jgi:SulP family sulfate permease
MRLPRLRPISLTPFAHEFREYRFANFRTEVLAALAVALLTIPQSIAYSLLAGLPPSAGIFSAIFGTMFAAAFGSSRQLIVGPSTGIAILIQTSIADILFSYYENIPESMREPVILGLLTQMVIIIGIIQIGASLFNVNKLLQFVSRSVMLGYFAGITVAIIVGQSYYLFGIARPGSDDPIVYKALFFFSHLLETNGWSLLVGGVTFAVLFFCRRKLKNWPDALFALFFASVLAFWLHWLDLGPKVETLADINKIDDVMPRLVMPLLDFKDINRVFPAAVAIAMLAILEVTAISRTFAARAGQRMYANQDVFGLGVANIVLSCISGAMPCSGSATRTALNYRMGAVTRLAAIMSGLFTILIVFFCWPWVQGIALPSLAMILIATAPTLTNWQEVKLTFRATREDAWVFGLTFLSCVIFSLDVAFFIGISISLATYLKKSAEPHLVEYAFNAKGRLMTISPETDVHRKVRIIGIGGELYFAAADFFQNAMAEVVDDPDVQAVVLRLNNVYHMDASMCLAIIRLYETLRSKERYFLISGLTDEVWSVFQRTGLVKIIGADNLYFTDESNPQFSTWKACLYAQELIHHHGA